MLADRVKHLREGYGWSQTQLAARAGLTKGCVSHIESGFRSNPYGSTIAALARALRVPMSRLLEEDAR